MTETNTPRTVLHGNPNVELILRRWLSEDHESQVMTLVEDGSFVLYVAAALDLLAAERAEVAELRGALTEALGLCEDDMPEGMLARARAALARKS